jgi:hypothetical protein
MPRKSLVQRSEVDRVLKSHSCRANSRHRLQQGERRLKVHVDRSHVHYCATCALQIIAQDIAKLQALALEIRGASAQQLERSTN